MSSIASTVRTALRSGGPAALAALAWWLAAGALPDAPHVPTWTSRALHLPVIAALLLCPGWGLLRVLSRVDRRFGVVGSSLCLSLLLLGMLGLAGSAGVALAPGQLHAATLLLALAGGVRQVLIDRWARRQPPHPAPMPLWPDRLPHCFLLLTLALTAVWFAAPVSAPEAWSTPATRAAAPMTASPAAAGRAIGAGDLFHGTVAVLTSAGGLTAEDGRWMVAAACLAAVLLFVAEGISRLRGNRGAPLAMLALLLAYQPLGALLALLGSDAPWSASRASEALASSFAEGNLGGALRPFLDGSPLVLSLAFAAMLLSTTLSVLRRSSYHVPRLAATAAFGLVLSLPEAAYVLLPGWIAGVWWAHRMGRAAAASDPASVATERRAGEPALLRAPFLALALPIGAAGALAAWWSGADFPPSPSAADTGAVTLLLLVAVFPCAVLFIPGVRQLHASPGREAYLFMGLALGTLLSSLCWTLPDFAPAASAAPGDTLARLLCVLAAVPIANGALVLADRYGRRARVALFLGALALLPGVLVAVRSASSR